MEQKLQEGSGPLMETIVSYKGDCNQRCLGAPADGDVDDFGIRWNEPELKKVELE